MLSDVRRLRALRAIGALGSFSAAADELGYTQSAVSQQLAALESEVGLTLVERTRPPRLNDAGRLVIEQAAPIFEQLASLEAQVGELRGLRAGRLRLGAFGSAFETFLAPAVAAFSSDHPDIELELTETLQSIPMLRAGELDLALVFDWSNVPAPAEAGLDLEHLLDDDLVVVMPARHPLARRRTVLLEALAEERWITPRAAGPAAVYWNMLGELTAEAGFEPRIAHELDNLASTRAFVAAGQGIALMNELTLPRDRSGLVVRRLNGLEVRRRVWMATVTGRRWPPAGAMSEVLRVSARSWS